MKLRFWTDREPPEDKLTEDEVRLITGGLDRGRIEVLEALQHRGGGSRTLDRLQIAAESMHGVSKTDEQLEWLGSVGLVSPGEENSDLFTLNSSTLREVTRRFSDVAFEPEVADL